MNTKTFEAFWKQWSNKWFSKTFCYYSGKPKELLPVSEKCSLKENYASIVHGNYEAAKASAKQLYFREPTQAEDAKRISRYKRAAVMTYAVIKSEPLIYKGEHGEDLKVVDPYYLKERLAVYVAIGSIIQDFPQEQVSQLLNGDVELYDFNNLGIDRTPGDDTFLESMYKDLFLSDLYGNYNVLTMANVYGLLTEKCSLLSNLIISTESAQ